MAIDLAPVSSGPIAQALDRTIRVMFTDLQIEITNSLDPDRCRADLLPWLAYHRGVDVWISEWTEFQKRAVIREAVRNFRTRGTESGIVNALGSLASEITIIEWWEEGATPATFRANVLGTSVTDQVAQDAIADIIGRTAPYTRWHTITVESLIGVNPTVAVGSRIANMINVDSKLPAQQA